MASRRVRHITFAIVIFFAGMLVLEGGARLLEAYVISCSPPLPDQPGWQTEFFGSLFEWHEPDPYLLWRFKANLRNQLITTNEGHFLGDEISRDKPPDTYRILLLGDSSPVGLGMESRRQTFGELLRFVLEKYWGGRKKVEVINAAVSGYSSEQVARLLTMRGWEYHPDLIILYCGNNDASVSGIYSDRELLFGQKLVRLRSALSNSALYRVLCAVLVVPSSASPDGDRELTVRVSAERFGENLRSIASLCRQHRTPLIVLKPPIPFLWPAGLQFKPFLHLSGRDGEVLLPAEMAAFLKRELAYCVDEDRIRELYGQSDIFTKEVYRSAHVDHGDPAEAIARYRSLLKHDSLDPVNWNNLGVAYWKSGDYEMADSMLGTARRVFDTRYGKIDSPQSAAALSPIFFNIGINLLTAPSSVDRDGYDTTGPAFVYLDSAAQCDYFSLRIKRSYWRQIDQLQGLPGIAVIDLPRIFFDNGGERLFVDHCHPTAKGHIIIAQTLYDTICARQW